MPVEFRLGEDGIPYAVEFANVAFWPRRPALSPASDTPKLPTRSKTLPSVRMQKPLPALPAGPTRGGSLRRVLRRFSEPSQKPPTEAEIAEVLGTPRRRSTVRSREERDEKTRDALHTLSIFSMLEGTPVDTDESSEEGSIMPSDSLEHTNNLKQSEPDDLSARSGGLYVAFRDETTGAPRTKPKDSVARLRRLTRTIADAVTAAGMIGPPKRVEQESTAGVVDTRQAEKLLFRGTYGQVRAALRDAGLAVKKCDEQGFDGACRVGTLFVANRDRHDNLIFTKVVLYGS